MRIRLDSIGCRLNFGEIEAMARTLAAAGHAIVGQGEPTDLCVLNTCTVTAVATRKSRHLIRQLRRSEPEAKIVVTGCLAELEADSLAALDVDLVVGNEDKDRLPEILRQHGLLLDARPDATGDPIPTARTRAFLKVQDGCDNACTFCIVTVARGRGRSVPADRVLTEIRDLQNAGYREVVLSGVHLGSYGHDIGRPRGLKELVRRILGETDLKRLRLSSLEPWDLDHRFFEIFGDRRLLPHLHLPLQSGCDDTLRRMARKTTVGRFGALLDAARDRIGDVSISTDIMVGFPGETDVEFEESISAVESFRFSRLHIFRYSRRQGTRAASMPDQIPGPVAQERSRRLHELGTRLMDAFHSRFIGRREDVLWEEAEDLGAVRRWSGLTGNYIRVMAEADPALDLENTVTPVDLEACVPGGMVGTVVEPGALPVVDGD
ncbi:MAG: tRNA (N(6)-L-threonylcarbamoyladenosine(37)-C(2))-methylthiotransferase MtaB [Thermoanaerobaculales bacterium]|jgi:threonylcarbamoyladenosine tRNA methylthiotransferase MtaB|nr:tRNA (N(6)-L-threonylcarbamoyladenosine(37)-C(2))-methylthiotransferase MtaB [Thermoanaerobaculales bacterium]